MFPMSLPFRLVIIAATAFLCLTGAYTYGYGAARTKFQGQLNVLKGVLQEADAQAHDKIKQQEEVSHEVEQSHDAHIQTLAKFYTDTSATDLANARARYRVLSAAANPAPASAVASSEEGNAGTTSESRPVECYREPETITGCTVEVEKRCAKDAERVRWAADFFVKHHFPVE